ncbi:MAG: response regulator [Acidobacteriota bacterium]
MPSKALVVDDSKAIRMLIAKTLRQIGYEVQEAANGREALDIIEAGNTAVELVLADWNMPEMNGLELLKRLRQNPALSSLAVVMVTTETEIEQIAEAMQAGANEYVMKPFTPDILVEKLQLAAIHP